MTRACGADDIKNILYPALFRKLRFQMIDDSCPLLFNLKNWQVWFGMLFLPLLYQWAIDSVFESGARHHVPYVAFISVLVGIALSSAVETEPQPYT